MRNVSTAVSEAVGVFFFNVMHNYRWQKVQIHGFHVFFDKEDIPAFWPATKLPCARTTSAIIINPAITPHYVETALKDLYNKSYWDIVTETAIKEAVEIFLVIVQCFDLELIEVKAQQIRHQKKVHNTLKEYLKRKSCHNNIYI